MPGDAIGTLRERNKARARAEIATAALQLFAQRGFAGVTVDEIVAAAGVSRRTFFRYFETKEDALLADYTELSTNLARALSQALTSAGDGDPFEVIRAGFHQVADWYVERREAVLERSRLIRDELALAARNLEFLSQWEKEVATAVARHTGGDSWDFVPRLASAAVVAGFRAALGQWVRSSCQDDLHGLIDRAVDLVRDGLAAPLLAGAEQAPSPRAVSTPPPG